MAYLPLETGIVDEIQDAIVSLLTRKLQSDVDPDDVSRLALIKVGPRQDDPDSIVVLIHENDPTDPADWPHRPRRYRHTRTSTPRMIGDGYDDFTPTRDTTTGYTLIGGGSQMERAFTIEIEVWGDEIAGMTLERRDVGHLGSVVESRIKLILEEAGPGIGSGTGVTDDFGARVVLGPFWGKQWTDQEEGESLILRKYLRLFYVTSEAWSTNEW